MMRWTAARGTGVVECNDPVNYRYVARLLERAERLTSAK